MGGMTKRIVAIAFIYVATSVAWVALGGLIQYRTAGAQSDLYGRVAELWGSAHVQVAPSIAHETVEPPAKQGEKPTVRLTGVIPDGSDIKVGLRLDQRRKGLLWFSTYGVSFDGTYTVGNTAAEARTFVFTFPFPAADAIYDDFQMLLDGREVDYTELEGVDGRAQMGAGQVSTRFTVGAGQARQVRVTYDSRGMDRWEYMFGEGVTRVKDFRLAMNTDFGAIDFPRQSISPTRKERTGSGWTLTWDHKNLISGFRLGMEMPRKLNPGPLASQITFFAPVSLLFFFFIIFVLSVLKNIRLHPMHYFFLAAAFFSFHLLFSYLVDHIDVNLAFVISAVTSVALVVSYLRVVVGSRFAFVEAGLAQFIYLILFSYAHFFRGFTGLTVTIGSIITLAILMQATARIDWEQKFGAEEKRL